MSSFNLKTFVMKSNNLNPKQERDNRSNQLNPNNDRFWQSRGFDQKPSNSYDDDDYDDDDDDFDDFADDIPCADWED